MTGQRGRPAQDLYRMLGIPRDASPEDIARAYRHKARDMHPDSRPQDTQASSRFGALAAAYEVLSDPSRRAAYDRTLGTRTPAGGTAPAGMPVLWPADGGGWPGASPRPPGAQLWAGPARVDPPAAAAAPGAGQDERARQAALAELILRSLGDPWDWPW